LINRRGGGGGVSDESSTTVTDYNNFQKQTSINNVSFQQKGQLYLKLIQAHFTRDTDKFGSMDPFTLIKCSNGQNFRSKTKKNEGQHPQWDEQYVVNVTSMGDELYIQCFDDDIFGSDLIGEVTIPIYKLCVSQEKPNGNSERATF
jgi:Ca2+-dependent lipid-binding protein